MELKKIRKSRRIKFAILFLSAILIVLMFPKGESLETEVNVGTVWIQDDLIAPFSFPIIKQPETYRRELETARESVYPIFLRNDDASRISIDSLKSYNNKLLTIIDTDLLEAKPDFENTTFLSSQSYRVFKALRLKDKQFARKNGVSLVGIFNKIESSLSQIYKTGVLSIKEEQIPKDSIAVRRGNIDIIDLKNRYFDYQQVKDLLLEQFSSKDYSEELLKAIGEYASHFIFATLIYSPEATREEVELAQGKVSRFSGIINENERIIAKHDRITQEIKQKIDSYRTAKGEMIGTEGLWLQLLGKFLHVAFLLYLLSIYIFLFRKKIYDDNKKLLVFAILILWVAFVTFLVNEINLNDSLRLLIFIPTASMLITIMFDSRIGFYSTVIISLIAGGLRGNDYTFVVMNIVAGALSVYTVRDIKNRTQIFRSFMFILIGYVTTILAFGLERFESWQKILIEFSFAGTNALISPVLTYGLLVFFEKIFGITTEITLLELTNFDRPLLRDLARKAPGTFNHSLTMGTLAEASAEAIGANPLLARVGAYYHDIGKTLSPQYFVENQLDNKNLHEELAPEESVKVLINHIKRGVELAEKHKLPPEIIDFIPMHHGTTVVAFFYDKAKKMYGEDKVNIDDYKYAGPKPNTKETAIVLLADSCESAVRAIEKPDSEKVENLISNLISAKINDGQLDDSPLTFRDIDKIKETFVNILLGQHHRRIRYPKQDELEKGE